MADLLGALMDTVLALFGSSILLNLLLNVSLTSIFGTI